MIRVEVAEWSEPTRKQRAVILAMSHLLTLLGLFAWTVGTAAPGTTAPAAPVPRTIQVSASTRQDAVSTAAPVAASQGIAVPARPVAVVVGTDGRGVWLRREPAGEPLQVWPDGAPMTIVGPSRAADGHDWRHVRAADGQVGWVAADFLAGTDEAAVMDAVGLVTPGGFVPAAGAIRLTPPMAGKALG